MKNKKYQPIKVEVNSIEGLLYENESQLIIVEEMKNQGSEYEEDQYKVLLAIDFKAIHSFDGETIQYVSRTLDTIISVPLKGKLTMIEAKK